MKRSIVEKQAEIKKLQKQIESIQAKCSHPRESLEAKYDGNSGYDYDRYWVNFHCLECDKRWRVDSKDPEYHREADIKIDK